jgi:hypothetical protein
VLTALENAPGVSVEGDRVTFYRRPPRPVWFAALACAVPTLGPGLALQEAFLILMGSALTVFILGLGLSAWNFGRQPAVVVDSHGVDDRIAVWGFGLIEWHEIHSLHGQLGQAGVMLALVLNSAGPLRRGSLVRRIFRWQHGSRRPDGRRQALLPVKPLQTPWEEFAGTVFQHPCAGHIREAEEAKVPRRLQ